MAPYIFTEKYPNENDNEFFTMLLNAHKDSPQTLAFTLREFKNFRRLDGYSKIELALSLYDTLLENPYLISFWVDEGPYEQRQRLKQIYIKLYQVSPTWRPDPHKRVPLNENGQVLESHVVGIVERGRQRTKFQVATTKDGALFIKMFATKTVIEDYSYLSEPS